jgi:hypothetical protein
MLKIRTLGLYQPFASLMLHGKIETRWVPVGKKPPFPLGEYLIYATQKCYSFAQGLDLMGDQQSQALNIFKTEFDLGEKGTINPTTRRLITGHAICIGNLVSIIDPILPSTKNTFVEYIAPCSRRRVGLVFENMKRIEPFPFKGKQGIGFLSEEDQAKIKFI